MKMNFCKNFARHYEKNNDMHLEHQTHGRWVVCPSDPATHCVILKIDGFLKQSPRPWLLRLGGFTSISPYNFYLILIIIRNVLISSYYFETIWQSCFWVHWAAKRLMRFSNWPQVIKHLSWLFKWVIDLTEKI